MIMKYLNDKTKWYNYSIKAQFFSTTEYDYNLKFNLLI